MADDNDSFELFVDSAQRVGVWANEVRIAFSQHEFTLDFVRLDHGSGSPPTQGAMAARVAVSPALALTLIRRLERSWAEYSVTQMPPDVSGE